MKRQYSLKSLTYSKLPECFEKVCKSVKYKNVEVYKGRAPKKIEAEGVEALKELSEEDLPIIINFIKDESELRIHFQNFWQILNIFIAGFKNHITEELYRIIEETLSLEEPTEEDYRSQANLSQITSILWRVYDNTLAILNQAKTMSGGLRKKLRCFLSFRFDDHSKALALEVREFLELIETEVISGLGFEPRSISEKVLDRLSDPLDLFIVIQSSTGDSAWLNQEIGVARGRNLPILVLREESSEVDLGMLGDTEYLLFPDNNISKAFVGVLQALSYIKYKRKSLIV